MQVILMKSVRNLGKVGETMSVADGYGLNFLVPQKLAVRATGENIAKFDAMKKDLEAKNVENKKLAEKTSKSIEGKNVNLVVNSAADGRLFGSVNTKLLAKEISKIAEVSLNYNNILLDAPIRFNGVYEVQVVLHPDVITTILVVVAKSETEAQDLLTQHKEGPVEEDEKSEEGDQGSDLDADSVSA